MSFLMQCPYCPGKAEVAKTARWATCPKCFKTFEAVHSEEEAESAGAAAATALAPAAQAEDQAGAVPWADKPGSRSGVAKRSTLPDGPVPAVTPRRQPKQPEAVPDEDDGSPSLWAAAAFILAALALFQGAVIGIRAISISMAGLGVVLALIGYVVVALGARSRPGFSWLHAGAGSSALVLLATLFFPTLVNRRWAIDFAVPEPDPQAQVVVPRTAPLTQGKPHKADEWPDATTEAVRQHEVVVRVDGVKTDVVNGRKALLVHVRIANSGRGEQVTFEGFDQVNHKPTLKDGAGASYALLEQKPRKYNAGGPIEFETRAWTPKAVKPILDVQLVFAPPPAGSAPYKLELPASAWGREGTCRLLLPESFTYSVD